VCMDMCMVDVTEVPDVAVGDEVVIIGRQGEEELRAEEMAALCDTISYEILCGIGPRVPRLFVRGGRVVGRELRRPHLQGELGRTAAARVAEAHE